MRILTRIVTEMSTLFRTFAEDVTAWSKPLGEAGWRTKKINAEQASEAQLRVMGKDAMTDQTHRRGSAYYSITPDMKSHICGWRSLGFFPKYEALQESYTASIHRESAPSEVSLGLPTGRRDFRECNIG